MLAPDYHYGELWADNYTCHEIMLAPDYHYGELWVDNYIIIHPFPP